MLIDWFTVAAQAINFLVLVWLLKRFLYRPVLAAIEAREKKIAAILAEAEKKKAEALKEQANFAQKNEQFEQQRSALLLEATNVAKTEREKLLTSARTEADELRSKLEKAAESDLESLNQKIGALAQEEVFSIARKALMDLAGVSLEERMTDAFIQRLGGLKDKDREALKGTAQGLPKPTLVRSAFELAPMQRRAIEEAVRPLLQEGTTIGFETKPDLISGIELAANGQKIGWNIGEYLTALTESMGALLKVKADSAPVLLKVVPHAA